MIKQNFRFCISSVLFPLTTNADVTKSRDKGYNAQTHRFPLVTKEVDHTGQSLFRLHVYPNSWVLRDILHLQREEIPSYQQYEQKRVRVQSHLRFTQLFYVTHEQNYGTLLRLMLSVKKTLDAEEECLHLHPRLVCSGSQI